MYVHIGGDYQLPLRTLIAILDLDHEASFAPGSINHAFLQRAEQEGRVDMVTPDVPRSLIISLEGCYMSPIAATTLRKRVKDSHHVTQNP